MTLREGCKAGAVDSVVNCIACVGLCYSRYVGIKSEFHLNVAPYLIAN
jgi:hypothetical protein